MKKLHVFTTLLFTFLALNISFAQDDTSDEARKKSGVYVRANLGYGFATTGEVQGAIRDESSAIGVYGTNEPGLYTGIGIGYMFNDYFGLDLGISYTLGKAKVQDVYYEELPAGFQFGGTDFTLLNAFIFQERTFTGKQIRLIPSLVVRGGSGKVVPYARFGLMIPIAGKTYTDVKADITSTEISLPFPIPGVPDLSGVSLAGDVTAQAETEGQFSLGWNASLGLDVKINDLISVFGELDMVSLTIKSKKTTITEYTGNYYLANSPISLEDLLSTVGLLGINIDLADFGLYSDISEMPLSEKEINYVDELNSSTNNPQYNSNFDENAALDDLALRQSYSSIGLNIGIRFNF